MTASATSLVAAERPMVVSISTAALLPMARRRFVVMTSLPLRRQLEVFQPSGAVADAVLMNVEPIQQAQQQISRRHRHRRICEVTIALQLSIGAADNHVRYVLMAMLIRVPHVRAVEHQRVIEQSPVSVRRLRQPVDE